MDDLGETEITIKHKGYTFHHKILTRRTKGYKPVTNTTELIRAAARAMHSLIDNVERIEREKAGKS